MPTTAASEGLGAALLPPVTPGPTEGRHPLSHQQEGLARMMIRAQAPHSYWLPWHIRLTGHIDTPRLAAAAALVVSRHPILRTKLVTDQHGAAQTVGDGPAGSIDEWPNDDLGSASLDDTARQDVLNGGAPWGVAIVDRPDGCALRLATHHLVFDQWSLGLLLADLGAAYRHLVLHTPLPAPPPLAYTDYARWQRSYLRGHTYDRLLRHWRNLARGYPPAGLPLAPQTIERPPSGPAETLVYHVDRHLLDRLRDTARRHGTTLFVTLFAVFTGAIADAADTDDVLVGVATANRRRAEIADVVGFFANGRFLRTRVTPDATPADLVNTVSSQWAEGHPYQELHLEKTALDIGLPDVVNVKFSLRNALGYLPTPDFGPGISVTHQPSPEPITARRDLNVWLADHAYGATAHITYRTDSLTRREAQALAEQYIARLQQAATFHP